MTGRRGFFAILFAASAFLLPTQAAAASADLGLTTDFPDRVEEGVPFKGRVSIENTSGTTMSGDITLKFLISELELGEPVLRSQPTSTFGDPTFQCVANGDETECIIGVSNLPNLRSVRVELPLKRPVNSASPSTVAVEATGPSGGPAAELEIGLSTDPLGPFRVEDFEVRSPDDQQPSSIRAGGTPTSLTAAVEFPSQAVKLFFFSTNSPAESFKNVITHVPPGLVGNPTAVDACTSEELASIQPTNVIPRCPRESQVGLVRLLGGPIVPLYNMVPPRGAPAAFGFGFNSVPTLLVARLRPGDNGIDIVAAKAPAAIPIHKFEVTIWGLPASPDYDSLRDVCIVAEYGSTGESCPSTDPVTPFLRMPTSCPDEPLSWGLEVDTYQHPDQYVGAATTTPAPTGCDVVPFDPGLSVAPTERSTHRPTGVEVELSMPQDPAPGGIAQSDLRTATVTLPEGVVVNPASADGLQACGDDRLRLGLEGPSECPSSSKIGSVSVKTPLLDHEISGSVILRSQASQDPASGDLYRLAIELRSDADGINIKLPGSLRADPHTGQLTTVFNNLPQLPFSSMQLQLDTGPRAPLVTPAACGSFTTHAELTSWARPQEQVPLDSSFVIDQGCERIGFTPGFRAGVSNPTAGEFSPFVLQVTREAGQPNISRIDVTLPEGELAKLADVPVCPGAQAAAGDCQAGSRIGSVRAGIGEGANPLYLPQPGKGATSVYLAGPYKGARYSVVTKVPAQAGPFDLGEVLVRSALYVDPVSTQVTIRSDALPQIFGGIPITYRDIRVEVERPNFTLSPTDCEPTAVTGLIHSNTDVSAAVSDRFQVVDCSALGFKPKLSLSLRGAHTRGGFPALTAVLKMPAGSANVARASVALPNSEFLAQGHLSTTCTRVQYAEGEGGGAGCPKGSVYGRAKAFSPLLDGPLKGPVYLRSNGGDRELPDLVASLDGAIHVDLVGFIDSNKKTGGLRTTFARVPDAPVEKFVLKMPGGRKSLLENRTNLCRGTHRAIVRFLAQNGKASRGTVRVRPSCSHERGGGDDKGN